ncbi:MAG: hypothetical protein JXR76_14055 [Deltaproteobacteria bacterium]|nr:hypothetical protein [Deltaproteobacteria bacterium]
MPKLNIADKNECNHVIEFPGLHEENPSARYNCILAVRENGRAIRPDITRKI